jgi:hypothetical protein
MKKTFRRKNTNKRSTNKHYKLLNKGGVITRKGYIPDPSNRVAILRDFFHARPGQDLTPFIVEPYSAIKLSSTYRGHSSRTRINYMKSLLPFLSHLRQLQMRLSLPLYNSISMIQIKTNLLATMPDGMTLERFLNTPGVNVRITELRDILNGNFIDPERPTNEYLTLRRTPEYRTLFLLVGNLRATIQEALSQHIRIPIVNLRTNT